MAYKKQIFTDDEVLYAGQLNYMEDGLSELSEEIAKLTPQENPIKWEIVGTTQVGALDETTGEFREGDWSSYAVCHAKVEENCKYRVTSLIYLTWSLVMYKDKAGNVIGRVKASHDTAEINFTEFRRYTNYEITPPDGADTIWVESRTTAFSSSDFKDYVTSPIIERGVMPDTLDSLSSKVNKIAECLPLKGKNIVNFGDSIFGWFDAPDDISTKIAELTGATVYNVGFGGMWMSGRSGEAYNFCMCGLAESVASQDFSAQESALETWGDASAVAAFTPIVETLKSIDFSEIDAITLAYGTNDFTANIPIDHETNPINKWAFASALRYSIETILTAHPHIKIYVCTPIYRFYLDESGAYSHDSDTATNDKGVTLVKFAEKAIEVAKEYHLPYIDNYNELGINKFTRLEYFDATDGTHPNLAGRHLIARHIAHNLW